MNVAYVLSPKSQQLIRIFTDAYINPIFAMWSIRKTNKRFWTSQNNLSKYEINDGRIQRTQVKVQIVMEVNSCV